MKRIILALFALAVLGAITEAQAATHSVTLTWVDTQNPVGTTYTVYRAVGLCSGTPTFAKLATGVALQTYKDTTVTPGNYCYAVSATAGGVESAQSVPALAPVPSFAPTNVAVTVL